MPARLHFSAIDESFKPDSGKEYSLQLGIGKEDFRFAVIDLGTESTVALEQYQLSGTFSPQLLVKELDLLFSSHPFLGKTAWKQLGAVYSDAAACIVPASLLHNDLKTEYFRLQLPFDPAKEQLLKYSHSKADAVMLSSCPIEIPEWLLKINSKEKFPVISPLSLLLDVTLRAGSQISEPRIFGLALAAQLHLVILENGQLLFCNSFPFKTPQDLVYFLLLAMQENGLSAEQHQVTLWGEFMPDSALYNLVRLYVRNVQLGKRPKDLSYSTKLEERFQHLDLQLYGQFSASDH